MPGANASLISALWLISRRVLYSSWYYYFVRGRMHARDTYYLICTRGFMLPHDAVC